MILLKSGLVLHITGIALMVGGTVAAFVLQGQLWQFMLLDKDRARILLKAGTRLGRVQAAGGVLIVTGGILMMTALHGVVMHAYWFKTKLLLLGLIILNAAITFFPAGKRLRMLLVGAVSAPADEEMIVRAVRGRMRLFYLLQFLFFLLIFLLSVFQPD